MYHCICITNLLLLGILVLPLDIPYNALNSYSNLGHLVMENDHTVSEVDSTNRLTSTPLILKASIVVKDNYVSDPQGTSHV